MMFLPAGKPFRFHLLSAGVVLALGLVLWLPAANAEEIQFNTDVLDVNDRKNIDLSQFARSGYIMPGSYSMVVHVNKSALPEQAVTFYTPNDDPKGSRACLSPELVAQLGLKDEMQQKLRWWHQNECLEEASLPGMEARGDLATSALYLEHSAGLSGLCLGRLGSAGALGRRHPRCLARLQPQRANAAPTAGGHAGLQPERQRHGGR